MVPAPLPAAGKSRGRLGAMAAVRPGVVGAEARDTRRVRQGWETPATLWWTVSLGAAAALVAAAKSSNWASGPGYSRPPVQAQRTCRRSSRRQPLRLQRARAIREPTSASCGRIRAWSIVAIRRVRRLAPRTGDPSEIRGCGAVGIQVPHPPVVRRHLNVRPLDPLKNADDQEKHKSQHDDAHENNLPKRLSPIAVIGELTPVPGVGIIRIRRHWADRGGHESSVGSAANRARGNARHDHRAGPPRTGHP